MQQRNPWGWGKPYTTPATPAVSNAVEPEEEAAPVETDGKPWDALRTHAQINDLVAATTLATPADWDDLTVAGKKDWLDGNA